MKTNKKLKYGKLFTSITLFIILLLAVVVGIVTVFALTQRSVDSSIFIRYTATDIDGSVNATYQLIGKESKNNGEVVDMGTINFAVTDGKSDHEISPAEDLKLTKATPYIEFTYIFTNNGSRDFTATVSLKDVIENNNISFNYAYQNYDYLSESFSILVQGVETEKNVVTYKIKMGVESFAKNAGFKGALFWDLKTPEIEDESTQMSVNSLNFTDKSDGTYSATFNGGEIKDKTLVIPNEINGVKITSVGKVRNLPYGSKVILSEGITSIENSAFYASNATDFQLPNSLEIIGYQSFYFNYIKSITIPKSVRKIGIGTFAHCEVLEEFIVEEGNTVYSADGCCLIENGTTLFAGCKNSVIPNYITHIKEDAFMGQTLLTSITIPKSVQTISLSYNGVFQSCRNLEEIICEEGGTFISDGNCLINGTILYAGCKNSVIPNYVKEILGGAFWGHLLEEIIIPDSVEKIHDYAFAWNSSMKKLTLGKGVKTIGVSSFIGIGISSLIIPDNVETLGWTCFSNCKNLTEIYLLSTNENLNVHNGAFNGNTAKFYCCLSGVGQNWNENWQDSLTEIHWNYVP